MPTNYIVWEIGLIPNFGHETQPPLCLQTIMSRNFFIEAVCIANWNLFGATTIPCLRRQDEESPK